MDVGLQIRIYRESKKLSRDTVATWLDMSPLTYSKIETGERSPTIDELNILAKKFEVNPQSFLSPSTNNYINATECSAGVVGNGNVIGLDKELVAGMTHALTLNAEVTRALLEYLKGR
jgi:transcriptional regulator with XRE-family HTH domain